MKTRLNSYMVQTLIASLSKPYSNNKIVILKTKNIVHKIVNVRVVGQQKKYHKFYIYYMTMETIDFNNDELGGQKLTILRQRIIFDSKNII